MTFDDVKSRCYSGVSTGLKLVRADLSCSPEELSGYNILGRAALMLIIDNKHFRWVELTKISEDIFL